VPISVVSVVQVLIAVGAQVVRPQMIMRGIREIDAARPGPHVVACCWASMIFLCNAFCARHVRSSPRDSQWTQTPVFAAHSTSSDGGIA
jgi:hypothetical protein